MTPLERMARSALSCSVGTLTWATDVGTIDQAGNFSAPACQAPYDDIAASADAILRTFRALR